METISQFRNNCVLVAIKEVSGIEDAEILRAVRRHNYKNNQGMYQDDYMKAAKELGLELDTPKYCTTLFPVTEQASGAMYGWKVPRVTLSDVIKKLTKGTFLVRSPRHLLVIRDGVLIDKNWTRSPSLGRQAIDYVEVKNARKIVKTGVLKIARRNTRKFGTAAYHVGEFAFNYLRANKNVTAKELLAAVAKAGYKKNWLAWDMKRGNIVEE